MTKNGSFRLFKVAGISVFLHWSWFIVAVIMVQSRMGKYHSPVWNVLEYLALFGMVLLHEFGHALACRSVGGVAEDIVLWPLGGVAFVAPPQRPGATLWSIAAGPLVNLTLAPIFGIALIAAEYAGFSVQFPDLFLFVRSLFWINLGLMVFNLLPVYPLDGGQILQSLLWFAVGRARSLLIAAIIGIAGVSVGLIFAIALGDLWLGIIAVFALLFCVQGLRQARVMLRMDKLPVHNSFACPSCHAAPYAGAFWVCGHCQTAFDTFETHGRCPNCGETFATTRCPKCGASHAMHAWIAASPPPP